MTTSLDSYPKGNCAACRTATHDVLTLFYVNIAFNALKTICIHVHVSHTVQCRLLQRFSMPFCSICNTAQWWTLKKNLKLRVILTLICLFWGLCKQSCHYRWWMSNYVTLFCSAERFSAQMRLVSNVRLMMKLTQEYKAKTFRKGFLLIYVFIFLS